MRPQRRPRIEAQSALTRAPIESAQGAICLRRLWKLAVTRETRIAHCEEVLRALSSRADRPLVAGTAHLEWSAWDRCRRPARARSSVIGGVP